MDEALINYLKKLELSESEAKLYLTILSVGGKTFRELAQILRVNRSTTFINAERLIEKELIIKIVKDSKTLLIPNNPKLVLENIVNKKIQSTETIQQQLPDITEELQKKYLPFKTFDDVEVKHYKGRLGVRRIYEEALKEDTIRSYLSLTIIMNAFPENDQLFKNAIKNNKNIKIFEIIEDSTSDRKKIELESENANNKHFFYKFLPKKIKLSAADTLIYNNKVAIINVGRDITGVVLHNTDYYNNTKAIFDSYWSILSDTKES